MVRVKICGITSLKDAMRASELGAWALGFIFYKRSPRYIAPSDAKKIIDQLPPFITPVGVFVNEKEESVGKTAQFCNLTTLQFHGNESPSFCLRFKKYKVIKAFRIQDEKNLGMTTRYSSDAFLFDTFQEDVYGGSGKVFNWKIFKKQKKIKSPIILSGGLSPKNIKKAIKMVNPYAVDISSGVELAPGVKNEKLLRELFKNIKSL